MTAAGSLPPLTDGLIRPALHVAFAVARAGVAADPPVEAPRPLRPFLRFVRLPDQALVAVRRALEDDAAFRTRVAEAAGEDDLGRGAWLYLNRPPGWEDELAQLAGEIQAAADAAREAKEERSAVRRLAQLEQAVERAENVAARARADAARAVDDLAEERRARRAAEEERAVLAGRVAELEEDAARGRRRATEAKLELSRWRTKVGRLEADLSQAAGRPSFDASAVHDAISVTEDALRTVRRALGDAEAAMQAGAAAEGAGAPGGAVAGPAPGGAVSRPASPPAAPAAPGARRRPAALPPAVFDDSAEAAAHLVRVPDVLVLVDGYNVGMSIWPGVAPAELRQRLVDALAELSARTSADVHVVFDGAELAGSAARPGGRLPVRVTFSAPEVEADDVILAMVEALPSHRPVVVASSDRRVQEGARSRGANVVSSEQLGQLLGR